MKQSKSKQTTKKYYTAINNKYLSSEELIIKTSSIDTTIHNLWQKFGIAKNQLKASREEELLELNSNNNMKSILEIVIKKLNKLYDQK